MSCPAVLNVAARPTHADSILRFLHPGQCLRLVYRGPPLRVIASLWSMSRASRSPFFSLACPLIPLGRQAIPKIASRCGVPGRAVSGIGVGPTNRCANVPARAIPIVRVTPSWSVPGNIARKEVQVTPTYLRRSFHVYNLRTIAQLPPALELLRFHVPVSADQPWHTDYRHSSALCLLNQSLRYIHAIRAFSGGTGQHNTSAVARSSAPPLKMCTGLLARTAAPRLRPTH